MGPRGARITAEDFLIPHEFRAYRLAERTAGQVGGVRAALESGPETDGAVGRTRLGECYQQIPLRVFPMFQFDGEPASLLYLINPTVGLLDGDGHLLEIEARPGTRAVVTGQSATRVHPAVSSFATQQWRVRVAPGARLVILPGPNIPFRGCRYHQRAEIELQGDARLIWGDIWTPGRYARDELSECHEFARIVQELEVRRDGVLVHRDRFHWEGPWDPATVRWHLGDGPTPASASLFVTGPVSNRGNAPPAPVLRSVLPLARGDTLIRWCGPPAALIREVVVAALGLAASWPGDDPARPWLIASRHLGPNHWFSVPPEAVGGR
jgi:urease accessory protein